MTNAPPATLRAAMVPADLAGSGWYEILPPAPAYPKLEGDTRADWVVVGAGFAGLSAALRIAEHRAGERIVVIDAQRVAWGAAGRNSGFMIDLPHELNSGNYAGAHQADLEQIAQNRAAIEFAREAAERFGLMPHFRATGKLHGAAAPASLRSLAAFSAHLDRLGEPYTPLDAAAMRRITGTDYYLGGLHAPGTVMIQPAAYMRGLAAALVRERGVEIFEHSPLVGLESGERLRVTTPAGAIDCGRVILAVNGHIESLGLYRRRLMHVFTYSSMTRALTAAETACLGGDEEWALIPAHPMGSTVRRFGDRIVVRNVFSWNPKRATSEREVTRVGAVHDRSFAARFPMLAGVAMEYRWGGHLCLSLNTVPAFGEVAPGVFAAACQNGIGVTKGTLSGMLAADLACGEDSELLRQWSAKPPPRRLYPEPFMSIGARARLRWGRWRAGRDL